MQTGTRYEEPGAGSNQKDANGTPPGGTGAPKKSGAYKKKKRLARLARQREALGLETPSPRFSGLKRGRSGEEISPNFENRKKRDTEGPQKAKGTYKQALESGNIIGIVVKGYRDPSCYRKEGADPGLDTELYTSGRAWGGS